MTCDELDSQGMLESHAFGNFVPHNARYLILGSFSALGAVTEDTDQDGVYDWFYATQRNQFWPILEEIYVVPLRNRRSRQALFTQLGIAIADIISQCMRRDGNALDSNLICIQDNQEIPRILNENQIEKIFFTSRFVEKRFNRIYKDSIQQHPEIELIALPSPSTRYARMSKEQKTKIYRELLPPL